MRKIFFVSMIFLLAVLKVGAPFQEQNLETVIIASTENYPDASIAAPVSEKLGIPILLVNKNEIPEDVETFLEENNPAEVVIVGGPAVISPSVEGDLEQKYNVTRLWGLTRYETAVEFAEFFWPEGSEKALLVQDDIEWLKNLEKNPRVLSLAKEISKEEKLPIFLISKDSIPERVLASLKELEVKKVILIGLEFSPLIKEELGEAGIEILTEITGKEKEVLSKIKRKIIEKFKGTLIVAGVANYKDALLSPNLPNSRTFLVSGDEDIENLTALIESANITKVILVGNPKITEKVYEEIKDIVEVEIKGNKIKDHVELISRVKEKFGEINKIREKEWASRIKTIKSLKFKVADIANKTIEKLKAVENLTADDLEEIGEIEKIYKEGKYFEALREAKELFSDIKKREFDEIRRNWTLLMEKIEDERESLKEKIEELRELNKEFAEKMREMDIEDRLEIIEEFKDKRKEIIKEIVKEAKDLKKFKIKSAIKKRIREKLLEKVKYDVECTDEVEENEFEAKRIGRFVKIEGEVFLPNPGFKPKITFKNKTVEINFMKTEEPTIQCLAKAEIKKIIPLPYNKIELKVFVDNEPKFSKEFELRAIEKRKIFPVPSQPTPPQPPGQSEEPEEKETGAEVKEFNVIARQWNFEPATIEVNEGDIVRIKIKSVDVPHGILIPEYDINEVLDPGKEVTLEFKADKKGTFSFLCSVPCGPGHSDMRGKLVVK